MASSSWQSTAPWGSSLGCRLCLCAIPMIVTHQRCRPTPTPCRRGVTGGSAMSDDERHQLLCQLRLLRLLRALPAGAELSPEERACVAAALEIERDLCQQREQANNLEGGLG